MGSPQRGHLVRSQRRVSANADHAEAALAAHGRRYGLRRWGARAAVVQTWAADRPLLRQTRGAGPFRSPGPGSGNGARGLNKASLEGDAREGLAVRGPGAERQKQA